MDYSIIQVSALSPTPGPATGERGGEHPEAIVEGLAVPGSVGFR